MLNERGHWSSGTSNPSTCDVPEKDRTLSTVSDSTFPTTSHKIFHNRLSLQRWSEIFEPEVVGKDFPNCAECDILFLQHDGRL